MFDQTFVNTHAPTRRPWTVALSFTLQTALVAVALIAPLLHVASLEAPPKIPIWRPLEILDLKPKPEARTAHRAAPAIRPIFHLAELRAPTTVPPTIDLTPDPPDAREIATSMPNATSGPSLLSLLPGSGIQPVPPLAPAEKPKPTPLAAPLRVGSGVQAAKLLFGPKPPYPPLARTTRTQGTVKILAIIARDGAVRNLQVSSGPPLLVTAALEAVRQWRYQPTLLNGEPVEVITEIEVNFTLSQ